MNNFQITVSAVDKATATIKSINASFDRTFAGIDNVGKSMRALTHEVGMNRVVKQFDKLAQSATGAARAVTRITAPITAFVGGGTLVGVAMLANEWGRLGWEISRTSQTIGVSADQLQALRGAARAAGVSGDDLTSGMKALGTTMQDALYGRNQQAAGLLMRTGIQVHKLGDGSVDTTRALMDMSRAVSNIHGVQAQATFANVFGLGSLLPLLRQGPAAIEAYERKVRELGGVMAPDHIQRAERFGVALNYLNVAGQGLKNTIGDALIPAFQPLVEDLTRWIALEREPIGKHVAEWGREFAKWVRSINWGAFFDGITSTIKSIGKFVDAIGGWKVAAIGVAAIMAGPALLAVTNIGLAMTSLATTTIPLLIGGVGALTTKFAGMAATGGAAKASLGWAGGIGMAAGIGWGIGSGINWLMDKAGFNLGGSIYDWTHADPMATLNKTENPTVAAAERKWGLPHGLLDSVWMQESGRGKNLRSRAGALGQFQFMPATAKQYGLTNPNDLAQSADAAGHMYSDLLKKYHGNLPDALAAYNWGAGNFDKKGMSGAPAETWNYVRDVMARMPTAPAQSLYGSGASAGATATATAAGAASPVQVQQQLRLHITGLPEGTRATVRTADGTDVPVRVGYAMPAPFAG